MGTLKLGIISDIHHACPAEQARGPDYEYRGLANPLLRWSVLLYRRHIWLRDPLHQGHLLDQFLACPDPFDLVVANGDYSCDTAFVGLSDDAAFASACECIGRLRSKHAGRFRAVMGDHELGKFSLIGRHGGMRLASFRRAITGLQLEPLWTADLGRYTLLGVTSSLLALPALKEETLPEERHDWERLRREHLAAIDTELRRISGQQNQRLLLFCHDPTALPFLWRETRMPEVASRLEQTLIGHLHSPLILQASRWLKGMPELRFMGHTARRLSRALRKARDWQPFKIRLCPSLAGVELLKDGGFLTVHLDPDAASAPRFTCHRVRR